MAATLFVPELESFADENPLLYETLNQFLTSINGLSNAPAPVSSGVDAPTDETPGTNYYQLDASGAVTAKWLNTGAANNNGGWITYT